MAVVREESAAPSSSGFLAVLEFSSFGVVESAASDGCGDVEVTVLVGRCAEPFESSADAQAASTKPAALTVATRLRNFREVFIYPVYRLFRTHSAKLRNTVDTIR